MKTCPACQSTYPDDFSLCPHDGAHLTAQATETEAQLAAGLSRRFRIVRRLGKGGMGTVFLAEQVGVGNRPVALKVLNRKLLDDPDFLRRFQNEAGSTGRIHHPNVVTIYESAQSDDGTPYIAMEFLEGQSLRELLKQRGALPLPEVVEILQQTAKGLNAAHKLGIIHRDLKPDNIFLTYPDDESVAPVSPTASAPVSPSAPAVALASSPAQVKGAVAPTSPPANLVVKIVDFGIAKLRESGAHTQTGTVLGTPAYMSYEQASGMRSDELDARSDIYSLGVVVYEMLTGSTPFHSDTPVGYLRMHLMEEPPPFRAIKPGLPVSPQIEIVVMKALTKDRNQRYGSVLEFAQEFAQAGEAGSETAVEPDACQEAAKPLSQTTITPAPKTIVPASVGDTVDAKTFPETVPPLRRKWVVSHWRTMAIVASIVWIFGAGFWGLKFQSERELELMNTFCHDTAPGSGPEYEKCLNDENANYAKLVPEERELAASVAIVPVLLVWGFIYLVLFLVRWINRAATTHPSLRKWLASNWKKIGMVASVVWILGMGIQGYNVASDSDSQLAAVLKQDCIADREAFDYSKCLREADGISDIPILSRQAATLKQNCIDTKGKKESDYTECLKQVDVIVGNKLPEHFKDTAGFAFVPVLLGWGFLYLLLFLVRRNGRSSPEARTPQVSAISKPPGKMKFVVITLVTLILVGAGTWYFSQHAEKKPNPDGSIKDENISSPAEAGPSKPAITVGPFALELTLSSGQAGGGSVAFSPDGKLLASGTGSKGETVMLWDVASGTLRSTLTGHKLAIETVAFSPDGRLLASGSDDTKVKLWDVASGTLRKTLSGHSDGVFSVAFSPDGKLLASGSGDTKVMLWDVASGTLRQTLTPSTGVGEEYWVNSVAFSPDGKLLASGSDTIKLWDVASGALRRMLIGHTEGVTSVAFSPDGTLLASGSYDKTVALLDVATGTLRKTLTADDSAVLSVAFSPDGIFLAGGGYNAKLWDVASGNLMQTLVGHDRSVKSVAFSPDGKLLASGSEDKTIKIWRRRENVTGPSGQ